MTKIEELEDYLQEIFDEYDITEMSDESKNDFIYRLRKNSIIIIMNTKNIFTISKFSENVGKINKIYRQIYNKKEMIQKRLQQKIEIKEPVTGSIEVIII